MRTIAFLLSVSFCAAAAAGPEKIKFPTDYLRGVLYQTLDRPDTKQYRELYAPAEAVEAVRKGQPIPHGTVLTLVQWSVEQDAQGVPLKDANGRFIKKEVIAHTVMEKQNGWGAPTIRATGRVMATGNTRCSPPTAGRTRRRTRTTRRALPATCRTPSRTS